MGSSANCEVYRSITDIIRLNNEQMVATRRALQLTLFENPDERQVLNEGLLALQEAVRGLDRLKDQHEQSCSECKR